MTDQKYERARADSGSIMTAQSVGPAPAARRRLGLAAPFGELAIVWLKIALPLFVGVAYAFTLKIFTTETFFFWNQDLPILALCVAITIGIGLAPRALAGLAPALYWPPWRWVWLLAAICLLAGWLGARWVFEGYALSLDEFLANFDARIFAHGQLVAPVAPEWRPLLPALQPIYMLPAPDNAFWASSYLPVNAAMRAAASLIGAESLLNPLLSAFAIVATYAVGRRLWPDQPRLALIAAVLLGGSAQLIVMGMSAYAMPAHLAFNMAWMWLFLRGRRLGHAGAIAVGFVAAGIHQVVFHPLFVAPFVLQLWLDRRWRLAALYTLAYAAICLFWIEYWPLEMRLIGVAPHAASAVGGGWFVQRALAVLSGIRIGNLGPMALSLVRFVTWQNPLMAPLAVAGALAAERAKGHLRALVLGVFLTIIAMLFLVPSQTHGWGYRYLHGLLGSIALLAAWSWSRLTAPLSPDAQRAAAGGLVAACALSLLVLTPIRAWQAWAYSHPYALANARIQAAKADIVLVDDTGAHAFNAGTIVRNDPFLAAGPKVMAIEVLDDDQIAALCARHSIAVFDGDDAAALGVDTVRLAPDPDATRVRALMAQLKCGGPLR